MSKEIFPRDKIFHRCCGFLLALFGSLFCFVFVFVFVFFFGGGGGRGPLLCICFSFFSFQFFSFFARMFQLKGNPVLIRSEDFSPAI